MTASAGRPAVTKARFLRRLDDPLARIPGLLVDVEVDDLLLRVEAVDGDHILANELIAPVVALLDFLEDRIADFRDVEGGELEADAAARIVPKPFFADSY